MTEKLYYIDSHLRSFDAVVTGCTEGKHGYEITLDRTAFFPEGGGQCGDSGTIGDAVISDTHEVHGEVVHYSSSPIPIGTGVHCELDWAKRFQNMQSHSGEHILSGVVHNMYGYDNVGFHMGADGVIVDFSGYISPEELIQVERRVNEIIYEDAPVRAYFPSPEELKTLEYRSKLELTENVRIVTIENCDSCACCAPHVSRTGEVGIVKVFESTHRKNGVRLRMLAGKAAFEDYCQKASSVAQISALLSAKQEAVADAVKHMIEEKDKLNYQLGGFKRSAISAFAESVEAADGNLTFFYEDYDAEDLRLVCNLISPKCGGICAAFSGNDDSGYKYVMASGSVDLRKNSREINTALNGRGGGSSEMIQGSVSAHRDIIEKYFNT